MELVCMDYVEYPQTGQRELAYIRLETSPWAIAAHGRNAGHHLLLDGDPCRIRRRSRRAHKLVQKQTVKSPREPRLFFNLFRFM